MGEGPVGGPAALSGLGCEWHSCLRRVSACSTRGGSRRCLRTLLGPLAWGLAAVVQREPARPGLLWKSMFLSPDMGRGRRAGRVCVGTDSKLTHLL